MTNFIFRRRHGHVIRPKKFQQHVFSSLHVPYSWILSHKLAIGPMPNSSEQWVQLDDLGFRSRFSCCYPSEEICPPPPQWRTVNVSLPDHRRQEPLTETLLEEALSSAVSLFYDDSYSPVYLHCFASRERSPLIAVGMTSIIKKMDIFDSLDWVRRCHPVSQPLYEHLDMLDQVIKNCYLKN